MTRSQFAHVVGASEKWVENTARLLGKRLSYTPAEAKWMGLVRILNQEIGVPLLRATKLSTDALREDEGSAAFPVWKSTGEVAAIVVDLGRFHSAHAARMSAALEFGGPRRRGRVVCETTPEYGDAAFKKALRYGIDLTALREGLNDSPGERLERLDENAAFVAAMRGTGRAKTGHARRADSA